MVISIRLALGLFLIGWLCNTAAAQTISEVRSSTSVTAASTEHGMRFTATADVVEMRLEIFSATGQKLFDTEFRRGNVFDWRTQDGSALSTEPHLWVVTVKTLAGQLRQRHGVVSWRSGRAHVQRIEREQIPAAQTQAWDFSRAAQTLPPLTMDTETTSFNVLADRFAPAVTITAHDSETGQVTSTSGALTFRTGDLFAGKDVERLRITEDGKIGIGTNNPQTALDVAGAVRASEGFRFPDGTTLTAKNGKLSITNSAGDPIGTEATGTGTLNRVAKWTETGGAGTLGDSAITETGGNVGIGTTSPASLLHLAGPGGVSAITLNTPGTQRFRFQTIPGVPNWGGLTLNANYNAGWFLDDPAVNGYFFKLDTRGGNPPGPNNGLWLFQIPAGPNPHTNEVPIFGVTNGQAYFAGNVGIGTTTPTYKLHVAGNVNFAGLRTETAFGVPNVIGGDSSNSVEFGISGATISGGGGGGSFANRVTENDGTVGGGSRNTAGRRSTVGGGISNTASGDDATVAGGNTNIASGHNSTVPGGQDNTAQGNDSFAAGQRAQALHQGSFVWSDSTTSFGNFFASTANNQFLVNAETVGIGTNAPGYRLDVAGRSRIRQNAGQTGGTNSAGLWFFQNSPATDRAFVGMETDNSVGFFGGNGGGWGMIMNTQTGDVGIGTTGPTQKLHVQGNGLFTGNLTVNGNVGIGTSSPDAKLSVNGHASKPGGGSWNVFSDERLKNIKGSFATGLNAVMKLKPLRYEYKNDNALNLKSEGEYIGFSAQAVRKVIPEAVTTNAQGYLLVNNDPIMWTMLNAIKEQQGQIEQQREQINKQQSLIEGLRKLVCRDNPNADVCK